LFLQISSLPALKKFQNALALLGIAHKLVLRKVEDVGHLRDSANIIWAGEIREIGVRQCLAGLYSLAFVKYKDLSDEVQKLGFGVVSLQNCFPGVRFHMRDFQVPELH
jgi:hypothetical protein